MLSVAEATPERAEARQSVLGSNRGKRLTADGAQALRNVEEGK